MELDQFIRDFANAMKAADGLCPRATSKRSGLQYRPGIGPFPEDTAVDLTVAQMRGAAPERYDSLRCRVAYPGSRQKCDLVLGDPAVWAFEIKMARFQGDNGKPDDTGIKDVISPFDCDRSAVGDCAKLVKSRIAPDCGLILYGFDDPRRPLDVMIEAFEALAQTRVTLASRYSATLSELVHPVFRSGRVVGWSVLPR